MTQYECDQCGACCQGHLIVEVYELDVLREPRLAANSLSSATHDTNSQDLMAALDQEGTCLVIACGDEHPCPFLGIDKLCGVYPTRPNACVAMPAGDEQCQSARRAARLPPLEPRPDAGCDQTRS